MSDIYVNRVGRFSFNTSRSDEKDYKTEYVSSVCFRNSGKTLFGDTPWYQTIEFCKPQSIDDLIAVLVAAKTKCAAQADVSNEIQEAIDRSDMTFKGKLVDGGVECECCGEVTKVKYGSSSYEDGKIVYDQTPIRCGSCGAYLEVEEK